MEQRKTVVAWLNDACAMEEALIPILENHAKDAQDHPELCERITQHVHETRQQIEQLKACLQELGEKPSIAKKGLASLFGNLQAPSTGLAADELVKNALLDFATENFEIACYQALIIAAEDMGEDGIAAVCTDILQQEQEMADWLDEHLAYVVRQHLLSRTAA